MSDIRRYGDYNVTFAETGFSIDGGKLNYSIHHDYKEVDNAGVYDSDKAWKFSLPGLRRVLGVILIIVGIMAIGSGSDEAWACIVFGIILLIIWKKEFVAHIKMNNGDIIKLKMPKDSAYAFCNDLNNIITRAKQKSFSPQSVNSGQVKSDVFRSRWENAEHSNGQNRGSLSSQGFNAAPTKSDVFKSRWEKAEQENGQNERNGESRNDSHSSAVESLKTDDPWFCPSCGRTNSAFVTICVCGRTKDGKNALTSGTTVNSKFSGSGNSSSNSDSGAPWFCPACGRVNGSAVTVCDCGRNRDGSKNEVTPAGQSMADNYKKWRCSKCKAINDGRRTVCYCGAPKQDNASAAINGQTSRHDRLISEEPNKIKFSYSARVVRIHIDNAFVKNDGSGCEVAFYGAHIHEKQVDALLCNVKLLDAFDEVIAEERLNFNVSNNTEGSWMAEYEHIDLDPRKIDKLRKLDIEVLKIAFK